MEIDGIFSALVVGLIVGALGRLVVPGKQKLKIWVTLLIGVVAALLGTLVASLFGVAETRGVDWIELALQVALAALGVAAISGAAGKQG
ncbi:GlsB/YeaQ/YmgE family stress response membrane protein [Solwaraspora sp. WMMD937]|uniref:GlsB/YeaQ/YmgE family stress response membrane protein n=1 Tax=Solwaraspora sp. WMMD937 TaxID=3016090 RepID=UPI00249BE3B8|nr:GlsB/YeaQ/YmgE family stress response membrane protein [Solwaraspora sp. WMMD937]WFE23684.1 GlsB/YeaQ/YmgE family stress response membrane protein [Solwaraspora sp. WMMD937]